MWIQKLMTSTNVVRSQELATVVSSQWNEIRAALTLRLLFTRCERALEGKRSQKNPQWRIVDLHKSGDYKVIFKSLDIHQSWNTMATLPVRGRRAEMTAKAQRRMISAAEKKKGQSNSLRLKIITGAGQLLCLWVVHAETTEESAAVQNKHRWGLMFAEEHLDIPHNTARKMLCGLRKLKVEMFGGEHAALMCSVWRAQFQDGNIVPVGK